MKVDVVVAGGGPAGAIAARGLALSGADVLLVDRGHHPRYKVCGCCLAGPGVEALAAEGLGERLEAAGALDPRSLRIAGWGRQVDLALGGTRVLSRASLDSELLDAARASGVEVRTGSTARLAEIAGNRRRVEVRVGSRVEIVEASLVLGATGLAPLGSTGTDTPRVEVDPRSRIGVGARYPAGAFPAEVVGVDRVGMRVGPGGYVGLSVLEDGSIDVAGALSPSAVREAGDVEAAVLSLFSHSGVPAPSAAPVNDWRGTPALTRTASVAGAERVLLIGDSAGYLEPFTGEGMRWAIDSGRAVVGHAERALDAGWSAPILQAWDREVRRQRRGRGVARLVTRVSRSPTTTRLALGLLSVLPSLARPLVSKASGSLSDAPSPHSIAST